MNPIEGGYYLKARCIKESDVASAPPHVREIWDYFLRSAFWRDGKHLKRGQLLTSYLDIQEALSWQVGYRKMTYKKHHCEMSMKWFLKRNMITTAKTTMGMVITVCNYDTYQEPTAYDNYTKATTKTTMKLQPTATIDEEEYKKGNKEEGNSPPSGGRNKNYSPAFLEFWAAYPKKRGKIEAARKFKSMKCAGLLPEILPAISAHMGTDEWKKEGGAFIPHPSTWLNQGRWEDVMGISVKKAGGRTTTRRYEGT